MVEIIHVDVKVFSNRVRCCPKPNSQTNKIVNPIIINKVKNNSFDETMLYADLVVLIIINFNLCFEFSHLISN